MFGAEMTEKLVIFAAATLAVIIIALTAAGVHAILTGAGPIP